MHRVYLFSSPLQQYFDFLREFTNHSFSRAPFLVQLTSRKFVEERGQATLRWSLSTTTLKVESFAGTNFRDFVNFSVVREIFMEYLKTV